MPRIRSALLASAALATLAACTPSLPPLDTERQWSEALSRFGLFAFYPLTEDIQVGDVLFVAPERDGPRAPTEARFDAVRIGSLPPEVIGRELANQGRRRLVFETVPATQPRQAQAASAAPRVASARRSDPERGIFVHDYTRKEEPVRLRRVALPTLTLARLTEGQLGVSGFFGNVGAALGIGGSGSTALTVTIKDTAELGIDASRAYEVMLREREQFLRLNLPPDTLLFHLGQLRDDLRGAFCRADFTALDTADVFIAGLYRVLYTRSIVFSFRNESAFAAKVAADLARVFGSEFGKTLTIPGGGQQQSAEEGAAEPAAEQRAASSPRAGSGQVGAGQTALDAVKPNEAKPDQAKELAAILGALKGSLGLSTTPGATLTLGISELGEVSLTETFAEPMAIGAGNSMRFELRSIISAWRELADGTRIGHGGGRTMGDARKAVAASCAETLGGRGEVPIVGAIAHDPRAALADNAAPRSAPLAPRGIVTIR